MNTAQIAELLDPFLHAPIAIPDGSETPPSNLAGARHSDDAAGVSKLSGSCHSEPAKAGEEPAVLSPAQLQSISTYIDILLRWNARINLTAIRDPEEIVTRHFGESLFAARYLFPASSSVSSVSSVVKGFAVADLGSGAGFPGLPLKLWAPHLSLTLIESNQKKAAFLREVTRALTLTDVNIQNARADTLTATFDVVTLRAVERFDAILPTAAALVAPSGRLALLIGAAQETQARSTLPHLAWSTAAPVPQSRSRILLLAHRSS